MRLMRFTLVLLLALLLGACGASSNVRQSAPPLDYAALVERLRADGAMVEPAGDASAYPLVAPSGRMISLNGERVSVFEYRDAASAEAEARQISPDGAERNWQESDGSGHSAVMDFVYALRWYQAGRLIVLYVGTVDEVGNLLQRELGAIRRTIRQTRLNLIRGASQCNPGRRKRAALCSLVMASVG